MKKYGLLIVLFASAFLLQNCGSVKVLDSWKSDNVGNVKDNNFLVVARTANKQARIAFENEIVKQMSSKGYQATASFTKFPNMNPDQEPSEERQKMIREILENEGFDGVVLTVLKDYNEETRVDKSGGYYAGGYYGNYYAPYYGGFYGYYYHPYSYSTMGAYVPETTTVSTNKIYTVETVIYDLTRGEEDQLITVVTSQIDNPSSASDTASEYVEKITKALQ